MYPYYLYFFPLESGGSNITNQPVMSFLSSDCDPLPPCHCCSPGDRRTLFTRSKICCKLTQKLCKAALTNASCIKKGEKLPILLQFSPVSHIKFFTWIMDNSKLNISHFYCLFFKHKTVLKLIHYINFQNPAQILETFFPKLLQNSIPIIKTSQWLSKDLVS